MAPEGPGYSYTLSDAELARYRAMAAAALDRESALWDAAGIRPRSDVLDMGCGPGTFLPSLAERTAPDGRVVGLDGSEDAVGTARALVDRLALSDRVEVVHARCEAPGLPEDSFDTVFVRNVLVHNGSLVHEILESARRLLRTNGHLFLAEPDITELGFPDDAPAERELEQRWVEWARSIGNDPGLGSRLGPVVEGAGFEVEASETRIDEIRVERSPAWTARQLLIESGFATDADVERWGAAIERRLATSGPMPVQLPVTVVVARPG